MLGRFSDINERMPYFNHIRSTIADTEKQGGYEAIDPIIVDYMKNIEPAGVDARGYIVPPKTYWPDNGPLVLPLSSRIEPRLYRYDATDEDIEFAIDMARRSGVRVSASRKDISTEFSVHGRNIDAAVQCTSIPMKTPRGKQPRSISIPLVTVVQPNVKILGSLMAHETDHWKLFLGDAINMKLPDGNDYSYSEISAYAEKRAYTTEMTVDHSLGYSQGRLSVDSLVDHVAGKSPVDAGRELKAIVESDQRRMTYSLGVAAIAQLFGDPTKHITYNETDALEALGVL